MRAAGARFSKSISASTSRRDSAPSASTACFGNGELAVVAFGGIVVEAAPAEVPTSTSLDEVEDWSVRIDGDDDLSSLA